MRICVFGAGAVGGHLAAKLAAAGHQVSVVARGANLAAIRANGIALREGARTAFVFVPNGIPWWYAQGIGSGPHARRPRPPDLSRLDPGGALARAIAAERVIGAAVYSSNDLVEPGVVVNHSEGRNMLVVGEIDDRPSERIGELRAPPGSRRRRCRR